MSGRHQRLPPPTLTRVISFGAAAGILVPPAVLAAQWAAPDGRAAESFTPPTAVPTTTSSPSATPTYEAPVIPTIGPPDVIVYGSDRTVTVSQTPGLPPVVVSSSQPALTTPSPSPMETQAAATPSAAPTTTHRTRTRTRTPAPTTIPLPTTDAPPSPTEEPTVTIDIPLPTP